jgi:hypothetical protein
MIDLELPQPPARHDDADALVSELADEVRAFMSIGEGQHPLDEWHAVSMAVPFMMARIRATQMRLTRLIDAARHRVSTARSTR